MNKFFDAVENGDARCVAELLDADPSLANATDTRMFFPPGYWAKLRSVDRGQPNPERRPREEPSRESALYIAVENRQTEVARKLIEHGANVNVTARAVQIPLWTAVDSLNGPVSLELVELLIESGADVNARELGGWTALQKALQGMDSAAATPKEVIELLLHAGAAANVPDNEGVTPLAQLLNLRKCADRAAVTKMLTQRGADVKTDHPKCGPLICIAAGKEEPEVLRLLVEAGADVSRPDESGATALHYAASSGLYKNIELLLGVGADPCAVDSRGHTAIEWIAPKLLDALDILEAHVGRSAE